MICEGNLLYMCFGVESRHCLGDQKMGQSNVELFFLNPNLNKILLRGTVSMSLVLVFTQSNNASHWDLVFDVKAIHPPVFSYQAWVSFHNSGATFGEEQGLQIFNIIHFPHLPVTNRCPYRSVHTQCKRPHRCAVVYTGMHAPVLVHMYLTVMLSCCCP